MMDYYNVVSSKHKEYAAKKKEEFERDLDTVNGFKVKIQRDDQGNIESYESHHKFDRFVCNCLLLPVL